MGALSALLLGMAFVVLLVAALNLTTVQSARTLARQPEIAVRLAMGSGRWPIVRQLLVEGFLLALGGGLLGLSAAWIVPRLIEGSILRFAPLDVMISAPLDARIVGATIVFCFAAALLFGLGPALRASRPDLAQVLKEGAPGAEGGRRGILSRANLPVLAEIALTLVLLVVGGLFLKAALGAADADPGFPVEGLIVAETDTSYLGWDEGRGQEASRRLRDRLEALPGVRSVEVAAILPFGMVNLGTGVEAADRPGDGEGGQEIGASVNWVGPRYFETLEVPLLRGRAFRESESGTAVILNQALAEKLWPGDDPLGRHVRFVQQQETIEGEVVGVVGTTRESFFESSEAPMLFRPFSQNYYANHHYHLRLEEGATEAALLPSVREAMREIDRSMPVLALRSFEDHLDQSFEVWLMRAGARIFGGFAVVALLLAVAGVYGVRAYSVERRTRELGIRMALGSSVSETLWLVLREGLRLGLVGGVVGLLLALAVGRLLSSFLVGVSASDPWVLALSLVLLLAVVLAACVVPARRAARLDPLEALRYE
jgi:predicted permease